MNHCVINLRDFYSSPLGQITHKLIMKKLSARWPDMNGLTIMGLGYATPYLNHLATRAQRIDVVIPTSIWPTSIWPTSIWPTSIWPTEEPSRIILSDGAALPLPDDSIDRLLLIHALEELTDPHETLREIWRILTPGGRLIAVVPNQRSIWTCFDTTPFSHKKTYDRIRLTQLMRDAMLTPEGWTTALNTLPFNISYLIDTAHLIERFGDIVAPGFGGALIMEASKRIHLPICEEMRVRSRSWTLKPALAPPPRRGSARIPPALPSG